MYRPRARQEEWAAREPPLRWRLLIDAGNYVSDLNSDEI